MTLVYSHPLGTADETPFWPTVRRRAQAAAVLIGIWSLIAVPTIYSQGVVAEGGSFSFATSVLRPLLRLWAYGILAMPIFLITRRLPFQRGNRLRAATAHVVWFLVMVVGFAWARSALFALFPGGIDPRITTFKVLLGEGYRTFLVEQIWSYGAVVAVAHARHYYDAARRREVEEANLRARLAKSELHALKLQLHPHFVFNTLNSVSALMATDLGAARTAIAQFSDVLRLAVRYGSEDEVVLGDELHFVDAYLQLQKLRFGSRLSYGVEAPSSLLGARVPAFSIQCLVENAVRHGIEMRRNGGEVQIEARAESGRLLLCVVNDAAPGPGRSPGNGLGLTNIRARLSALYGNDQSLELIPRDDMVRATISIPLRLTEGAA